MLRPVLSTLLWTGIVGASCGCGRCSPPQPLPHAAKPAPSLPERQAHGGAPADSPPAVPHASELSHDGRIRAFVVRGPGKDRLFLREGQSTPQQSDKPPDEEDGRLLLDLANVKMLDCDPRLAGQAQSIYFFEFSVDDRLIYFLSDAWANERGMYSVEVATGVTRYVMGSSNYFHVIDRCREKQFIGQIVVRVHFSQLGSAQHLIDWYYVVDKTTKRIGPVGPGDDDARAFFANRCGVGEPPPAREKADLPASLRAKGTCGELTLQEVKLLDGSTIELATTPDGGMSHHERRALEELLPLNCPEHFPDERRTP